MNTAAKYQIETRSKYTAGWTTDGIGDQNEFDSAAEARVCVRELRSYGDSWTDAEYRIAGPQGIDSAEMDAEALQYAIDCQLKLLGLSGSGLGRSSMVCNLADNGIEVTLSDNAADWCTDADAEEVLAILERINAEQSLEEIREELASKLDCM